MEFQNKAQLADVAVLLRVATNAPRVGEPHTKSRATVWRQRDRHDVVSEQQHVCLPHGKRDPTSVAFVLKERFRRGRILLTSSQNKLTVSERAPWWLFTRGRVEKKHVLPT